MRLPHPAGLPAAVVTSVAAGRATMIQLPPKPPAGGAAPIYYIQWTITEDQNGALPQSWGQAQLRTADSAQIYSHQFNDRINASTYYIINGSVADSTGLACQTGDKGVMIWNTPTAGNSLQFAVYRNGAQVPQMGFSVNGLPAFTQILFASGVEPITGIIIRNTLPASFPL